MEIEFEVWLCSNEHDPSNTDNWFVKDHGISTEQGAERIARSYARWFHWIVARVERKAVVASKGVPATLRMDV